MTRPFTRATFALTFGVWISVAVSGTQSPVSPPSLVDFRQQIQPILAKRCLECHSGEARKGGLSLATYADALDGGRNGPVIRPGNEKGSLLVHRLTGEVEPQMPKDEDPLTAGEVEL